MKKSLLLILVCTLVICLAVPGLAAAAPAEETVKPAELLNGSEGSFCDGCVVEPIVETTLETEEATQEVLDAPVCIVLHNADLSTTIEAKGSLRVALTGDLDAAGHVCILREVGEPTVRYEGEAKLVNHTAECIRTDCPYTGRVYHYIDTFPAE